MYQLSLQQLTSYGASLVITLFFIWSLQPIALRLGLVDSPGGRKQHWGQIPLIGGIAMFLGFAFAILMLPISLAPYRSFLAASLLLVVVGVLDDLHELSAKTRLLAQLIASFIMVFWGGIVIHSIGNVFALGPMSLGYFAIPFTIFATVAAINAVNMIDGIDGLAGGVCLIELIMIAILLGQGHHFNDTTLLYLLIAALIGFLLFNFPWWHGRQARVFMGDSGSMFLGFAITWFLIKFSQGAQASYSPVIILWILAIPVFDIITVTFHRLIKQKSPIKASQDHIHHVLRNRGVSKKNCVLIICVVSALFGLTGVVATIYHVKDNIMFFSLLMMYGAYLLVYGKLKKVFHEQPATVE